MKKHIAAAVITSSALLLGGVAFAFDSPDGPKPTTVDSSSTTDESTSTDTESSDVEAPDTESGSDTGDATHPDNHGADVSEAAHTCPTGPEHGKCVSAVAHEGKDSTDSSDEESTGTESESDDESTESDNESSDAPAANDTTAARHGNGHGH